MTPPAPAPSSSAVIPRPQHFGPDGWGRLTPAMTEQDALSTGELQKKPATTTGDRHVYFFPGATPAAGDVAFLTSGGAEFAGGELVRLAAPKDAATDEGIRRGSTVDQLRATYPQVKQDGAGTWRLPADGHPGWSLIFQIDGDTISYLLLARDS